MLRRTVIALLFAAPAALLVWIWVHNGNLTNFSANTGNALARLGGLTGLLGGYLALVQVILLARIPWLERGIGFDRLTVWHRWNGHLCIDLIVAHVFLIVWGYSIPRHVSFGDQLWKMLGHDFLPGMVTATVGTALLVVVVLTSLAIARRRLRYELWYAVHLTSYAGIALAWFHEIPTGPDLALVDWQGDVWRALFALTLALIAWRVLAPLAQALRHRLRVLDVVPEAPGVVSIRMAGRRVDRLRAEPGQFFLWRFLTRGHWATAHPFSLSAAPGDELRITVKAVGDHTRRLDRIAPGTRVLAEGPFGAFTAASRRREKVLYVAGGIGITPIRALAEGDRDGSAVLVYRALSDDTLVFREELAALPLRVEYVVGDHAAPGGAELLSPAHLAELVPDLQEREVYLCGPPGMVAALRKNVLRAGVKRRHLHVERFAL